MNKRNFLMYPEGGDGGAAGGGAAAGAGAGAAAGAGAGAAGGAAGAGAGAGGAGAAPDIRTQFGGLIGDAKLIEGIPDDRVAALYPALKGKFDELGKSFPAEWRKMVAGDNAEHLKTLDRFASPKALYDSYAALRAKLSSGELRPVSAFPAKGTPEEQSAWRQANGVPEKAEDYKFQAPEGVKLGDADKADLQAIQKAAFENNVPAQHAQAFASWFVAEKQARMEKRAEQDASFRTTSDDALRSEYGNDYRANMNRVAALLEQAPKGMRDMLGSARLKDGTLLGDHPDFVRFFVDLARQVNPAGVVLPGAGADIGQSVADEIAKIEGVMKTNRKAYNDDPKMQQRLRELYTARDRMGKKAA